MKNKAEKEERLQGTEKYNKLLITIAITHILAEFSVVHFADMIKVVVTNKRGRVLIRVAQLQAQQNLPELIL